MKKLLIILPLSFVLLLGFTLPLNLLVGNWYQQFMPNLNGAIIKDIIFTDSLNGYAVTSLRTAGDSAYILKTTNGGDNWTKKFIHNRGFERVQFINANTGFTNAFTRIYKTTNAGENWSAINLPGIFGDDMFVLNQDTIWLAMSEGLTGGVFRTTNGGINWTRQLHLGSQNPDYIYMYNARIGFVASSAGLYKTTNSGINWFNVSSDYSFSDMFFLDSLTGFKANRYIKKTTDGGSTWVNQPIPEGGNILGNGATGFMNKDNDTIWAVGETLITGGSPLTRGILFRTTNGGNNWSFQLPDTAIHINVYYFGKFFNNKIGWAYSFNPTGIHTTNGGDTTFYIGIQQISNNIPKEFELKQNYPNPFNPRTVIPFSLKKAGHVKLYAYDILGRFTDVLVDGKYSAGEYETDNFMGKFAPSSVYFYRLTVDDVVIDTKKMVLVK